MPTNAPIDLPAHQVRELATQHLGRRVLVFDRLESTNSLALSLAGDVSQHGVVIQALEQSAGRGQYGRSWLAPPGSSVLMSLLFFPPPSLRRPALLVSWAAVAVCEVVRAMTGLEATIKWPNDVLFAGKKVCGVLIEQRNTGNAAHPVATVVGIGLNVTQPAETFAAADLPDAASLYCISGRVLSMPEVAAGLLKHLDASYGQLLENDLAGLRDEWQARLGLVGKPVRIEAPAGRLHGSLRSIAFDAFELVVDSQVVRLAPEAVRQIVAD